MNTKEITKEAIIEELSSVFEKVNIMLSAMDDIAFGQKINGKWSPKENLIHLLQSTKPVIDALDMPKITLLAFGKSKNGSMSYNALLDNYHKVLKEGAKASGKFLPSEKMSHKPKSTLLEFWNNSIPNLESTLDNWNEKSLDEYRLPHPVLGKLTIREMLYFTILHTQHHLTSMSGTLA